MVTPLGNGYVQISRNVTHTSVSITNLWGAGIYESTSGYGNLAFPFTFAEQPAMNICVVGTSSYAVMGIETPFGSYSLSKTNTGGWYYYRPDNHATDLDITVSIVVTGKVSQYSVSQIPDHIISQGVSGDWSYRKWESGIAECWLDTVRNTDVKYGWGEFNISEYALNSTSYPIEFVDYPIVAAGAQGINHDYAVMPVVEGTAASLTTSPKVYVGRPSGSSVTVFKDYLISIYVVGRWK